MFPLWDLSGGKFKGATVGMYSIVIPNNKGKVAIITVENILAYLQSYSTWMSLEMFSCKRLLS